MTAPMPTTLLMALCNLTCVNWELPCHHIQSFPIEFRQRYIDIELFVRGEVGSVGIGPIVELMISDETSHACVFVNFKSECTKWAAALEVKIAEALLDADVLQINGDMDKNKKFSFVHLFTSAVRMKHYHPRILVATTAANTGIDQVLISNTNSPLGCLDVSQRSFRSEVEIEMLVCMQCFPTGHFLLSYYFRLLFH